MAWRRRHIAHRDLGLVLKQSPDPLPPAAKDHIIKALAAIEDVLNVVEKHYTGAVTSYDLFRTIGNAEQLLNVIQEGVMAEDARMNRFEEGTANPADHVAGAGARRKPPDWVHPAGLLGAKRDH